jgi:hypothetical protein
VTRGALRLTAALLAAALLPACGFSAVLDKRDTANLISRGYQQATGTGFATGQMKVSITIVKLKIPIPAAQKIKEGFTTPTQAIPAVFDIAKGRTAVLVEVDGKPQPIQAFDASVVYQLTQGTNRSRPWVAYDMRHAYPSREEHKGDAAGNNLLNPTQMFELLPGVLTGSIKNVGQEPVAGVPTTHYKANFDATKALKHAPKERQEGLIAALDLMGVKQDSIAGEVWLDQTGLPRQVLFHLREKITRRAIIAINMAAVLEKVGETGDVPIPTHDQSARSTDLGAISRGLQGFATMLASQVGTGGAPGGPQGRPQGGQPPVTVPPGLGTLGQ